MIEGLGRIHAAPVLGTIQLNGDTKLIVNPWAAIGTDGLLVTMSISTLVLAKNPILKGLSILGGIWGIMAITLEVSKLLTSNDPIQREV